ncbi:MAG: phosphate ABC transporter substrate-binding protein [Peptococcaceae bacterium]|nr:phosphate ABC transporter substrate-binding protein [Peptococcaceae bacterium]
MIKKVMMLVVGLMLFGLLVGCSGKQAGFDSSSDITVVSREDGSGTRGAFIELMGIEVKGADGSRSDKTTKDAIIANKTDVVMANVSGDPHAIGYISLGSLNDTVKAVKIDGVEGSVENIKNGTYKIARPFNIAIKGVPSGLAKDFIDFIFSAEGQGIVAKNYIPIHDQAPTYSGSKPAGKIVIAGSSSVSPLMDKLIEGYKIINTQAEIELQTSDSTAGMTAVRNGTADIGMASRDLKDSEKAELKGQVIAMDGVVVVVNKENPVTNLTSDEVKGIYKGSITSWSELLD